MEGKNGDVGEISKRRRERKRNTQKRNDEKRNTKEDSKVINAKRTE